MDHNEQMAALAAANRESQAQAVIVELHAKIDALTAKVEQLYEKLVNKKKD